MKMPLSYNLPNGKVLHLTQDILTVFRMHRQTRFSIFEAGGILLGRFYSDSMIVEKATTPGEGDRQGPLFFHRNRSRAQRIVDKIFEESGGEQTYLGEWHTHNEGNPHPSWKDRIEIERAFRKSRLNVDFMICIIVGNQDTLGNLWLGFYDRNGMRECSPI